ncbi:hypothetical protein [Bifidobacterium boum]
MRDTPPSCYRQISDDNTPLSSSTKRKQTVIDFLDNDGVAKA